MPRRDRSRRRGQARTAAPPRGGESGLRPRRSPSSPAPPAGACGARLSPARGGGGAYLRAFEKLLAGADAAATTRAAYAGDVGRFIAWHEAEARARFQPSAVTPMDVASYRDELVKTHGRSPATVNRALASLRRFFRWLVKEEKIPDTPMEEIRPVKEVRAAAPKALSMREVNALMRQARSSGFPRDRVRNYALVQLLVNTGIRLGELVALRWTDVAISERKGELVVRAGKGLKARTVPINATARKALAAWHRAAVKRGRAEGRRPEYVMARSDGAPLTSRGVQQLLGDLAARAQLEPGKVTPHVMRHTMATGFLATHPGELVALAALLGHASVATTAIYTKPSAEDLAEKMEALPSNYAR